MADEERETSGSPEEDDAPASTPFDSPWFLPVLLWPLSAWFGYDGWLTSDPEMLEHSTFNRVGFVVLILAALWTTYQAYREVDDDKSGQ